MARRCRHKHVTLLGAEGGAQFFRCDGCRAVIVVDGGHLWRIGPVPR